MNRGLKKTCMYLASAAAFLLLLVACGSTTGDGGPGGPGGPKPGACTHTLSSDVISRVVLAPTGADCDYYLARQINLKAELVVMPGTRIVAAEGAMFRVEDSGSVQAVGTADERIEFVGEKAVLGSWYGFCFMGDHRESRFDHVDIVWAGGVYAVGVRLCRAGIAGSVSSGGEPVHVTNSLVLGAYTSGIDATRFTLGEFSNNVLAGHVEYGLRVSPSNAGRLDASTDYTGAGVVYGDGSSAANGRPYVFLASEEQANTDGIQEWQDIGVPYYVTRDERPYATSAMNFEPGTQTLIHAGVEIVIAEMGGGQPGFWIVNDFAVLALAGEPGNEVVIRGEVDEPGVWEGIWMYGGGLIGEHAVIANAGRPSGLVMEAPITWDRVYGPTHCSHLRNVTIRNSPTYGVYIDEDYEPYVRLDDMSYEQIALVPQQVGAANGPAVLDGVDCE